MITHRLLHFTFSTTLVLATFSAGTSIAGGNRNLLPAKPADRPFRILVLGDSVTWGQGLATEHKFSSLTAKWVCEQRNGGSCPSAGDVDVHVEAHSGAVLAEAKKRRDIRDDEECLQEVPAARCKGEIPNGFPTIWSQVDLALNHYRRQQIAPETVDLIIVDGGINDMGALRILAPVVGGSITKHANDFCLQPMQRLLAKAGSKFPKAVIVVTGYFPLISPDTPRGIIFKAIRDLFPYASAPDLANVRRSVQTTAAGLHLFEDLPTRSRRWQEASDTALLNAVNDFNRNEISAGRRPRATFARVNFDNAHGYGAPNSFLWQLVAKGEIVFECTQHAGLLGRILGNLIVNDEQKTARPCTCAGANIVTGPNGIKCMRAAAFHPNSLGAQVYFAAIKQQLEMLRLNGILKL